MKVTEVGAFGVEIMRSHHQRAARPDCSLPRFYRGAEHVLDRHQIAVVEQQLGLARQRGQHGAEYLVVVGFVDQEARSP